MLLEQKLFPELKSYSVGFLFTSHTQHFRIESESLRICSFYLVCFLREYMLMLMEVVLCRMHSQCKFLT